MLRGFADRRPLALDDVEHRIPADPKPVADFTERLTGPPEFQNAGRVAVGVDSLTDLPTDDEAPLKCGGNP